VLGRIVGLAFTFLLAGAALHATALASGPARHQRPNVPIVGWYTDSSADLTHDPLAGYHKLGMSLVVAAASGNDEQNASFLARAASAGIHVLFEPSGSWIRDGDWTELRAFVERFRDAPALYGWYLFDEPDFNDLPAAQLAKAYRVVKSADGRHPVAVVFSLGACSFGDWLDRGYLKAFDLLMFDEYPFYRSMKGPMASLAGIREFQNATRGCVAAAHRFHKQGPIMVEQGFGNGVHDGPFTYRDPTYAEEKAMFQYAVRAGAPGILFFDDAQADHRMRVEVRSIVSTWRRGIPHRYRPLLPAPLVTASSPPSGPPDAPLRVCPGAAHCPA
jgi:hypothetical protein